jgi:hypothetical protein
MQFMGTIGAVMIGGGLLVSFFYAIFWADLQIKRGLLTEDRLPFWWFLAAGIPPIVAATCIYVAVSPH